MTLAYGDGGLGEGAGHAVWTQGLVNDVFTCVGCFLPLRGGWVSL